MGPGGFRHDAVRNLSISCCDPPHHLYSAPHPSPFAKIRFDPQKVFIQPLILRFLNPRRSSLKFPLYNRTSARMVSSKGKPTDPKLREEAKEGKRSCFQRRIHYLRTTKLLFLTRQLDVKQLPNKDGGGKGQMAAWKVRQPFLHYRIRIKSPFVSASYKHLAERVSSHSRLEKSLRSTKSAGKFLLTRFTRIPPFSGEACS